MTRVVPALLLAVLAVVAAACGAAVEGQEIPGVRPGVVLPAPQNRTAAPSVRADVLGSDGQEQVGVPDFAGRVLVVNFWASWCGPCRAEQPDLNEAYEQLADQGVAFLGVNIQDTVPNAQAHEREFSIPYPSIYDPANAYAAEYRGVGPRSIPTTIVIDRQGRVALRLFGSILGPEELFAAVEPLLGEPA